jgi:UPF0755 protein
MLNRPGYLVVCGALALLVGFMAVLLSYGQFSASVAAETPRVVQVRPGETLRQVMRRLADEGVVQRPHLLTLLGVLRGDSAQIKAGEYVLEGRVSPNALLDYLVAGRARLVRFTVVEGLSLAEIAVRLEAQELGRAKTFLALARDRQFIASLGLPLTPAPPTLEGFLFPETYYFHRGVSEATLIATLVEQFKRRAAGVLLERAEAVGLTPYQALVLASIVEKETSVEAERTLVSAVFHNRLRRRMPLASDPTVIYGVEDFDGNLRRVHLRTVTPYNTYRVRGLPPTPIANPGLRSIEATLAPANSDYLFFVSRGDGTHVFSKDYRTHERAVFKYQVLPHRRRSS